MSLPRTPRLAGRRIYRKFAFGSGRKPALNEPLRHGQTEADARRERRAARPVSVPTPRRHAVHATTDTDKVKAAHDKRERRNLKRLTQRGTVIQ